MKEPSWLGLLTRKTEWKEALLSERRHVVYYFGVAAGGYGDVCILSAEHIRKLDESEL